MRQALRGMRCVGPLKYDASGNILEVGVPRGVIAALCPSTSPVSTTIYKALLAIKSGNAIIFTLHPRAERCMGRTLDLIISASVACGLPEGCISYLSTTTKSGTVELMRHPAVSLVLITGVAGMLDAAEAAGKPLICGGTGNGPAFIERSADVRQAVRDIVFSKTFDCGIAPSAEQCVVVDSRIAEETRRAAIAKTRGGKSHSGRRMPAKETAALPIKTPKRTTSPKSVSAPKKPSKPAQPRRRGGKKGAAE